FIPATDVATACVNRCAAWIVSAVPLPALALAEGIPPGLRTLVAVPTLLASEAELLAQVEMLEVHFLGGTGGDIVFALLVDGADHPQQERSGDAEMVAAGAQAVDRLNERHGPAPDGSARFHLLHRRRLYNAGESCWMGWERKRGKLHELDRLL